jgi:large subunit ribosomal protein L19
VEAEMGVKPIIDMIEKRYLKTDVPEFRPGDTVRVHVRIREGEKERIQVFEGVVIGRAGASSRETFTVRKISSGIAVERVFPVHSPYLERIEVASIGRVRRAKLYYLRARTGKAARIRTMRERRGGQSTAAKG